jgi:signal transduction histidine kinase
MKQGRLVHIVSRPNASEWLNGVRDAAELLRSTESVEAGDLSRAIRDVLRGVHRWMSVEALSVLLYRGQTGRLELTAVSGADIPESELANETHRAGQHITGSVFESGKPLVLNDVTADPRCDRKSLSYWRSRLPSRSLRNAAMVPFSTEYECRGVFRAYNRVIDGAAADFTDDDLQTLTIVATTVAGMIEVLWERHSVAEINKTIADLATQTNISSAARTIVDAAANLSNSPASTLYIIEPFDQTHFRLAGIRGFERSHPELQRFPVQGSISGEVAKSGKSQAIKNLMETPGVANRSVAADEGFVSSVIVPTPAHQLKGCLVVFSRDVREYHRSTILALENLALVAANILDARMRSELVQELRHALSNAGHSARGPAKKISKALDKIREVGREDGFWEAIRPDVETAFAEMALMNRRLDSWLYASKEATGAMGVQRKEANLSSIVHRAVRRYIEEAAQKGITLKVNKAVDALPRVPVDEEKIELAFDNLVENAIKYSWKNQVIEIQAESTSHTVCISVTDHGLGIPEAIQESIFDPTVRSPVLDRTRYIPGTGLGLQIVKNIVAAHQGSIRVESKPFLDDRERIANYEGFMTVFWIILPRD